MNDSKKYFPFSQSHPQLVMLGFVAGMQSVMYEMTVYNAGVSLAMKVIHAYSVNLKWTTHVNHHLVAPMLSVLWEVAITLFVLAYQTSSVRQTQQKGANQNAV